MKKIALFTMLLLWTQLGGIVPVMLAQSTQASIRGSIQDQTGAVLVGVIVTARNLETGNSTSTISDYRGSYEFSRLDAGQYEVQAEISGFRSQVSEIAVTDGEARTLDFTLEISPLTETVTVTRTVTFSFVMDFW